MMYLFGGLFVVAAAGIGFLLLKKRRDNLASEREIEKKRLTLLAEARWVQQQSKHMEHKQVDHARSAG